MTNMEGTRSQPFRTMVADPPKILQSAPKRRQTFLTLAQASAQPVDTIYGGSGQQRRTHQSAAPPVRLVPVLVYDLFENAARLICHIKF